ncbi:MAG: hypothetical protein U0N26_05830 [Faecalibacterium prausnitzii]
MRLRKTMKRTAAAVLALSMAVSAAALPASAGFNIDMSKVDGDVEITQVDDNGSAKVTIKVGGVEKTNEFSDGKEGNDVTITGDNTKPTATESLNAEDENTSEVEKSGENTSEVEKSGETEEQAQEPGSLELLAPEDEEKQAQQKETEEKPAETQESEQDEQTEQTSDQVIEYGQYDPEAQQEAAKPAPKPAAEQETGEKKTAEEKTYEATNAPTTLTEKAQAAANNVVKIINNSANALKVILRDLKVDAGNTKENAVTVSGSGNVTLELDGKNELKGGSYWSKDDSTDTDLSGGHGLHAQGKGTLTIQDEDKNGSLTAAGGDVETSSLSSTMNSQWLNGGDGIRASNLTVSGAEIKAEGGNSKATGTSDMMSGGGAGIRVQGPNGGDAGTAKFLDGAHFTAKGGDAYVENQEEVVGGIGIAISANAEIEGVSISAAGGSAEGKKYARSGSAMDLYGNYMQYTLSMKDSALELTGGNAKAEGEVSKGPVLSEMYHDNPTLKNLTITAVEGKTKASKGGFNGGLLYFNGGTREVGGNSTITLVGTMTDGIVAKDNTVVNLYVPEGETLKKADSVDKISADETGKVNIYENATTTKNEDGSITVTGDLVGIKQDGHSYELTATVEPTCTTPGKRVYTCTTHEDETYEEIISDALGHHFVNGVCTRCGAPESNGGSSAVTLTVTGAGAYETSIAEDRYVVAVPAETAVLSGCLSNLKELKAQGVNTLVFRTQLRETVLNIDSMLSLGVDDTLFTLTHSGESAELTVGGVAHNELLH